MESKKRTPVLHETPQPHTTHQTPKPVLHEPTHKGRGPRTGLYRSKPSHKGPR